MWSFIFYVCCFAPSIFPVTQIVDLTYAQYQGVPTLDPVNNESITQFLGIRYAAAPTGKVFPCLVSLILPVYYKQDPRDSESLSFLRTRQAFNWQTNNHPSAFKQGLAPLLKRHSVTLFPTPALLGALRLVVSGVQVRKIAFS